MLFDRSPAFLRAVDAACAVVFAALALHTDSIGWAVSAAISAALAVTGASVHLQAAVRRALRVGALALAVRRGGR